MSPSDPDPLPLTSSFRRSGVSPGLSLDRRFYDVSVQRRTAKAVLPPHTRPVREPESSQSRRQCTKASHLTRLGRRLVRQPTRRRMQVSHCYVSGCGLLGATHVTRMGLRRPYSCWSTRASVKPRAIHRSAKARAWASVHPWPGPHPVVGITNEQLVQGATVHAVACGDVGDCGAGVEHLPDRDIALLEHRTLHQRRHGLPRSAGSQPRPKARRGKGMSETQVPEPLSPGSRSPGRILRKTCRSRGETDLPNPHIYPGTV